MANLYFQTAFLGDLLLAIPSLKHLKKIFPQQPLYLICRKGLGSMMLSMGVVDKVFEVDKNDSQSIRNLQQSLKTEVFENIFCPHQSFHSAWILKGIKAKRKVAFKRWWNRPFFNIRIQRPLTLPDALRQMTLLTAVDIELKQKLAQPMGLDNLSVQTTVADWPEDSWVEWASMSAGTFSVNRDSSFVLFAPGSVWNTKRWTEAGFIDLGRQLEASGYRLGFIGSPEERDLCLKIAANLSKPKVFAGELSLFETCQLLRSASALVTNDSGAMHMAAVTETPTVAIFGPTTLNLGYRPWQKQAVVVQKNLHCRPCGAHGAKICPIGTHECMKSISAVEVFAAFQQLLKDTH